MEEIRAYSDKTNDTLDDEVKHCRVAYTHDRTTMKIFLEASGTGVQKEVVAAMVQLGATAKKGAPPKSHQERVLQLTLDEMAAQL
eukprot:3034311-Pyramimonas_sp.AAC.1